MGLAGAIFKQISRSQPFKDLAGAIFKQISRSQLSRV